MQVMTNTTLGKKIKLARTNKELTQQELAACVGVTKQAITNYETGKRKPKQGTLLKIARVLAVSLDYLFNTQSGTPEALQELNNISNKIDKNDMKTKLVPIFSAAGAGRGHITQDNAIYKMPTFAGDYGVIVQGDSMAPRINTGAIVFVREVNGFEELKRGEVVVVRINGDEATVKYMKSTKQKRRQYGRCSKCMQKGTVTGKLSKR